MSYIELLWSFLIIYFTDYDLNYYTKWDTPEMLPNFNKLRAFLRWATTRSSPPPARFAAGGDFRQFEPLLKFTAWDPYFIGYLNILVVLPGMKTIFRLDDWGIFRTLLGRVLAYDGVPNLYAVCMTLHTVHSETLYKKNGRIDLLSTPKQLTKDPITTDYWVPWV